jgi:cytochrome c-type biogenesis protein CcmE
MKPKTIVGLILIVGFTSVLFLSFGQQVGAYMSFEEAEATGSRAHVVGKWVEDRAVQYDREQNVFSFYMEDEKGQVRLIHYTNPKPANFEDAEKLVIEGRSEGDAFVASHILVKCPSKYNDTRGLDTPAMNVAQ